MPQTSLPLFKRLAAHVDFTAPERRAIEVFSRERRKVPAKTDFVKQGERFDRVGILHRGWAIRAKALPDGRRAILNFMLPGDLCCMYCPLVEVAEYSVTTVTEAEFSAVDYQQAARVFRQFPRVGAAFGWLAAQDDSATLERASCLGQRTAYERMAHMLLEFRYRLLPIGLVQENSFHMPLTQELLADSLGMSQVHANRILRRLKQERLLDVEGATVRLLDVDRLQEVAAFDHLYLHQRSISDSAMERLARSA